MSKIIVYSTPTCPHCHHVKDFLAEHNVEFDDINVASDREKAQEMVNKSGQMGVPVIEIDGEIIIGADFPKIKQILGLKD
ncbi:MAG: glutaredoxin family protein [Candidatus Woesearchaeota archaeon]